MKTNPVRLLVRSVFIFGFCLSITVTILSFSFERNTEVTEIYKNGKLEKRITMANSVCQGALVYFSINAKQNQDEIVKWKHEVKHLADMTYEISFTPSIKSPWHIYSMDNIDGIGLPTAFYFNKNPLIVLEGKPKEIGAQEKFVQVVKLKAKVKTNLTGEIEFMACTNTKCLPPKTVAFNVKLE